MKTARQLSRAKAVKRILAEDPDYFAKLAAKRKGEKNPNMARTNAKEAGAIGGANRGKGVKNQQRKKRSDELQDKLKSAESHKAKLNATQRQVRKGKKHVKSEEIVWNEGDSTVDEWL